MAANNQKKLGFFGKLVKWLTGEDDVVETSVKKMATIKRIKSKDAILEIAKFYRIKKNYIKLAERIEKPLPAKVKKTDIKKPTAAPKKTPTAPKKAATKPTSSKPNSGASVKKGDSTNNKIEKK